MPSHEEDTDDDTPVFDTNVLVSRARELTKRGEVWPMDLEVELMAIGYLLDALRVDFERGK